MRLPEKSEVWIILFPKEMQATNHCQGQFGILLGTMKTQANLWKNNSFGNGNMEN